MYPTMPRAFTYLLAWAALSLGLVMSVIGQEATAPSSRGVIKVARVVGDVSVTDLASSLQSRVGTNSLIVEGQVIETGSNSTVVLVLSNGAVVNVRPESRLEVTQFLQNPFSSTFRVGQAVTEPSISTTKLTLRKGEIISQVKKLNREAGSSFTVDTPVGAAGIRGTAFRIGYVPVNNVARFALSMAEGVIQFIPGQGRAIEVVAGRQVQFNAQLNPATGAVLSIPSAITPTSVSAPDLAGLQGSVADAMSSAVSVQFAPSTGATQQVGAGAATQADPTEPEVAAPDAGPAPGAGAGPSAAPPATPDPIRTTGGDGE